jgi:anti-anti-sigma factor
MIRVALIPSHQVAAMLAEPFDKAGRLGRPVVTREQLADCVEVVVVAGELDMATTPILTEALDSIDRASTSLVVDMTQVSFIDSHSVYALLERSDDGPLLVVVPHASIVRRVLELTSADRVLCLSETLDEALPLARSALQETGT